MAKAIADYFKLKSYADEQEKKNEASNRAKEILEEDNTNNFSENDKEIIDKTEPSIETEKNGEATITIPSEIGIEENGNIFSNLEKVDDYFRNQKADAVLDTLNLEKLENNLQTADEVRAGAKNRTDAKYNALKENVEAEYARKQADKEAQKESAKNTYNSSTIKINEIYDNYSSSAQNQALKRGLARSSIIIGQLDGIEKERAEKLSNLAVSLNSDLEDIENEISFLNSAKDMALNNLDLEYASEVYEEIEKAIDNLNKKQKEITEFNNKVESLKAEYNLNKREKDTKDLKERLALNENYGYTENTDNLATQYKIKITLDYLNSLSKNDALKQLTTDSTFAYYLGDAWSDVYYLTVARKN
ncbi:MAG: hypothetical protein IJT25_00525 [Clostridia bacterium]|nr:hypothetical protein [Clostridia bacterium]